MTLHHMSGVLMVGLHPPITASHTQPAPVPLLTAKSWIFDIRNGFSTCQRSWYFAMTSVAGIRDTRALVT